MWDPFRGPRDIWGWTWMMGVLYRDYRGTMSSWLLVRNGQASKVEDAME